MEKKIIKYNKLQMNNINNILNIKKNYQIKFNYLNKLCIYLDNKLILVGDYNFYGIYQNNTKLWIWASSIPGVQKNHIKNIKKIKKNDYLFENSNTVKNNFYYQLLTQDILLINNNKMLSWINELFIYLSNSIFYFNPVNSDNNMQFLSLINITEKYI